MTAIEIKNLSKQYGNVKALDQLNLVVESGCIFGFLGPNGAGKTTTLRILTGLACASGGQAWIAGQPVDNRQTASRLVGYLPEEPAFYRWMTPVELLDHVGRIFGQSGSDRRKRSNQLLDQVGLTEVAKRRISGFSRGMRQRLGLAQALMNEPQVLLLDEPVSALDPLGRKEVLEMIEALKGKATVFMSTHILADVERICDVVGIINKGRLIVQEQREELLHQYTTPVFEIELDNGSQAWMERARKFPFVETMTLENSTIRVLVKDIRTAQKALLDSLAADDLLVRRFEILHPSLEDVFLRLTGKGA
jgi:ABC-2 type transport system ATP-binding protein